MSLNFSLNSSEDESWRAAFNRLEIYICVYIRWIRIVYYSLWNSGKSYSGGGEGTRFLWVGKRGWYKRNNVYNASVRRNTEFVSLSAIIFWNLHTNRSRALYHGKEGEGGEPVVVFGYTALCIEKRSVPQRRVVVSPRSYRQLSTTLKFYLTLFRGEKCFSRWRPFFLRGGKGRCFSIVPCHPVSHNSRTARFLRR